jgi:hypothetical protein
MRPACGAQAVAKHIIPWGKCPSDEKKAAAEAALIKEHGRNIEIIHVITGVRGAMMTTIEHRAAHLPASANPRIAPLMPTFLSGFIWKCVDPIHDFIVPKGCSTLWRRTRILSGFRSSRACTVLRTASCSQREIRRS